MKKRTLRPFLPTAREEKVVDEVVVCRFTCAADYIALYPTARLSLCASLSKQIRITLFSLSGHIDLEKYIQKITDYLASAWKITTRMLSFCCCCIYVSALGLFLERFNRRAASHLVFVNLVCWFLLLLYILFGGSCGIRL